MFWRERDPGLLRTQARRLCWLAMSFKASARSERAALSIGDDLLQNGRFDAELELHEQLDGLGLQSSPS
jgi:hypothetical protein